jgi:hypothetical protein
MATAVATSQQQLDVAVIDTPANVRDLDAEHVDALAASIQLQGLLVPLVVRASDTRYELVAGFHRFAAVKQLGASVNRQRPGRRARRRSGGRRPCGGEHRLMPTSA